MGTLLEPFGSERGPQLARQFAAPALSVADGAFLAHHVDPEGTDVRALFALLRRALAALARELLAPEAGSFAEAGRKKSPTGV